MEGFTTKKLREGVYLFLDAANDSFYLVEGEERAAVIDTGITKDTCIMPLIREVTEKPLILLVTHLHLDHMHHMDEFDEVYMCHDEFSMGEELIQGHMAGKKLDVNSTLPIDTGSVIDLGNRKLEICKVSGHTPGSVAIYDRKEDLVFTGDAIGSGCGVWLQLHGCKPLTVYKESLIHFLSWLVERGGRMTFLGGHYLQYKESRQVKDFNPLSLGLLCDLIDLVDQVLKGENLGNVIDLPERVRMGEAHYATYGRAELLFSMENIREKE